MSEHAPTLILCPYCLSVIYTQTVLCPFCQQDTTNDAKFEMSLAEYGAEPRKNCAGCATEILTLAMVCPICHHPQTS